MLRCILLEKDIAPNLKFDWSEFSTQSLLSLNQRLEVLKQGEEEITKFEARELTLEGVDS